MLLCSHRVDESLQINDLAQRESIQMPHSALLVIQSNRISIQCCEFNLCPKLNYRINICEQALFPYNELTRKQNRHFLINLHYKSLRNVEEYNNFNL